MLLVFLLLFAMFNNVKDGLLVFTGIPFALTGGVLALVAARYSHCRFQPQSALSHFPA
jgi:Cu/Ag efflux pump CusA